MLQRLLPLMLIISLSGCLDGLGIGRACEAEMQQVRRQHGAPDRYETGVRSEIWFYGQRPGGFYYEFSWGSAGDPCRVSGPLNQSRLPEGEQIVTGVEVTTGGPAEHRLIIPGGESR